MTSIPRARKKRRCCGRSWRWLSARVIDAKSLPAFTQLPNLATLRAQLVGLLSSPGTQLAGILSQAGGGELAATLEARRRDLEA